MWLIVRKIEKLKVDGYSRLVRYTLKVKYTTYSNAEYTKYPAIRGHILPCIHQNVQTCENTDVKSAS